MKKKAFTVPYVFLTTAELNDIGGASAIGGGGDDNEKFKPVPMSFEEWQQSRWFGDYDRSGGVSFDDYASWWAKCNFGTDTWTQLNPTVRWKDEWDR